MAADFVKSFEKLNVSNVDKLAQDTAISKHKEKLKLKDAINRATQPSEPIAAPVAKARKLTVAERAMLQKTATVAQAKQNEDQRHKDRNKLEEYWRSPIVGQFAPHDRPKSARGLSDDELTYQLKMMRRGIGMGQSGNLMHIGFVGLMKGLIWGVHGFGFNPMGWELRGLTPLLDDARQCEKLMDRFQPELEEMRIELGSALVQPWYMRLAEKIVLFGYEWTAGVKAAELNTKAASMPVQLDRYDTKGL